MQNTLGLPELLENIISHLPERDILCNAQRASRHWKTIIDSSPTIQKKIWLQPVEQPAISPIAFSEDEGNMMAESPIYPRTTLINPLLIGQDTGSYNWLELSPELTVRMKPMGVYGRTAGRQAALARTSECQLQRSTSRLRLPKKPGLLVCPRGVTCTSASHQSPQ